MALLSIFLVYLHDHAGAQATFTDFSVWIDLADTFSGRQKTTALAPHLRYWDELAAASRSGGDAAVAGKARVERSEKRKKINPQSTTSTLQEDKEALRAARDRAYCSILEILQPGILSEIDVCDSSRQVCATCQAVEVEDKSHLLLCSRCRTVMYCSPGCQKECVVPLELDYPLECGTSSYLDFVRLSCSETGELIARSAD